MCYDKYYGMALQMYCVGRLQTDKAWKSHSIEYSFIPSEDFLPGFGYDGGKKCYELFFMHYHG